MVINNVRATGKKGILSNCTHEVTVALFTDTRLAQEQADRISTMHWGQGPKVSPIPEELLTVDGHLGRVTFI